ncbi:RNA polymerase I associated factor, A49-like protein [Gloeophyllum trabeum ATCC 11539]|uniref:RNA polymerase I associated factor, A49-like protein n=1 Tax=Gloeophyllum trabeum (strain ATCC 11539 / FP-39264 / Madison 617) TaxID=670483 RepID=S7Q765_GLOTA|nr:RNA polymerase I associated factor, A49-like protein [Gloeophyllum trabeum ATCC 11539]EPQ55866.1 RNA polymerase I associated factor, A49-like protein [Gloeophyllum trabeum ATCC 11539]
MASTSISKKRKRDEEGPKVSFRVAEQKGSGNGPVLASFPAVEPPPKTPFRCYAPKRHRSDEGDSEAGPQSVTIAGETDTVEFSTIEGIEAGAGCRYLIGIHDKRTNKTVIRPAPLHVFSRQVKALKGLQPAPVTAAQRIEARNALGEIFGTKKAKAAIRAHERNKVDVSAMQNVAGHLQDRIESSTTTLPTKEEAKATADSSRLIPRYNGDAATPEDVYGLHDIIPELEWNALPISAFMAAQTQRDRVALLPYTRSTWVNQHLQLAFSAPKVNRSTLKILFYISSMLAFRNIAPKKMSDKQALQERLSRIPSVILDGLLSRFSETARDSDQLRSTPQTETSLLTHMFALCLRVDDYATDTTLVASDLSMQVAKVNALFKSLGCKIEKLSMTELKRLGLPDSAAATKRAVLKIPLEFPRPRAKRRT